MSTRILWLLALLITLGSAVYQRMTGPTYPLRGKASLGGESIRYKLPRTWAGEGGAPVGVPVSEAVEGRIAYRHHNSSEALTALPMAHRGGDVVNDLPHQPPAGKLDYTVVLSKGGESVTLGPATIRFRGDVPPYVLIPHILAMFGAMLWATRAGLERFAVEPNYRSLIVWTILLLTVGGLMLGPAVQKYSFGAWWTGWPFGADLTDNKTAVAWLAWVFAWVAQRRGSKSVGAWCIGAALVTLIVFAIPHSMFGSELKQ